MLIGEMIVMVKIHRLKDSQNHFCDVTYKCFILCQFQIPPSKELHFHMDYMMVSKSEKILTWFNLNFSLKILILMKQAYCVDARI